MFTSSLSKRYVGGWFPTMLIHHTCDAAGFVVIKNILQLFSVPFITCLSVKRGPKMWNNIPGQFLQVKQKLVLSDHVSFPVYDILGHWLHG